MKGNMIIIDQKVYKKHDLPNLPHGLTLENVSTVSTPDGVAFSGHNSPLSNLYKCALKDNRGRSASSVEQMYTLRMAEICGASLAIQDEIKAETNPYNFKAIACKFRKSNEWNNQSTQILKDIIELKFTSQPSLLFYEATLDPVFGCGYLLRDANQITCDKVSDSSNLMGKVIKGIRDKYRAH